jgi:hypothetical protein
VPTHAYPPRDLHPHTIEECRRNSGGDMPAAAKTTEARDENDQHGLERSQNGTPLLRLPLSERGVELILGFVRCVIERRKRAGSWIPGGVVFELDGAW